jgi:hypothetical protein
MMEGIQAVKIWIDNGVPIAIQTDVLAVIHIDQKRGA